MDIKIVASLFVIFLMVRESLENVRKPRKFYYDDLEGIDENEDQLESMIELSKPTLRTILRGLVTLLLHIFPDCAPKSPKKEEEGVKIFRQIVACPGHPYPFPYPQKADQLPPELQELINSRVI